MAEEPAVLPQWRLHPTDGAAVNARRFDGYEEASVKAGIVREHRLVALVGVENHKRNLGEAWRGRSPFSEVEFSRWNEGNRRSFSIAHLTAGRGR
jgi:hypothetical protein